MRPGPTRFQEPSGPNSHDCIVLQIDHHDLVQNLGMNRWIVDRHQAFNAPIHVPVIQSAELMKTFACRLGRAWPLAKTQDARMLQKTPDDRLDADIFRQSGHTRAQAADAADHAHNLRPGLGARYSASISSSSTRLLSLIQMPAGFPARANSISSSISLSSVLRKTQRTEGQRVHPLRLSVASQVIEQPGGIPCQVGVRREERQVGVDASP